MTLIEWVNHPIFCLKIKLKARGQRKLREEQKKRFYDWQAGFEAGLYASSYEESFRRNPYAVPPRRR